MKKIVRKTSEDKFYEALVRLMKTNKYESITITDVSNEAGLSRMTFYRHFTQIDDIMIKHLKKVLSDAEERIRSRQDFTKKSFWLELVTLVREDPVNQRLMEAGLLTKAFKAELDFVTKVYQAYFGLDVRDSKSVLYVYRTLGSIVGCFFYLAINKNVSDEDVVNQLISIAENAALR
ncbi:MAG: TetR/AcrR family transcriptional regulator [Clostridia bacterium]|nr:TetR/AcrR family transcriptional regulator [Clostridia bacterium]